MSAVNFDGIEPGPLSALGGSGKIVDEFDEILFGGFLNGRLSTSCGSRHQHYFIATEIEGTPVSGFLPRSRGHQERASVLGVEAPHLAVVRELNGDSSAMGVHPVGQRPETGQKIIAGDAQFVG
jgi:hypothetical protein